MIDEEAGTSLTERCYGVWLYSDRIGALNQRGDYTWFAFSEEYLADPGRAVLGLIFEQDLRRRHASALRLPPWFSNLLPEGRLRDWIAADRRVSADREMELLAQVGHDLPGAVRIVLEDESGDGRARGWRFSLAGVGLKFSMLRRNDRLTLPAFGEGGDWIVKLPDATYADVPRNEHAMMTLAASAGIEVQNTPSCIAATLKAFPRTCGRGWRSSRTQSVALTALRTVHRFILRILRRCGTSIRMVTRSIEEASRPWRRLCTADGT